MSSILFSRSIGPVPVDVIVRETHQSSLGITEYPTELGAKITDHSYVEPKRLVLEFGDGNAVSTYNALVRFQESRRPFTVISGLFVYKNMLIKSLTANRDVMYSRILDGRVELQEAIIVSTAYTASDGDEGSASSDAPAGGNNTTRSARPTSERTATPTRSPGGPNSAATQDRASSTVMRGDAQERTVPPAENRSVLSRWLG